MLNPFHLYANPLAQQEQQTDDAGIDEECPRSEWRRAALFHDGFLVTVHELVDFFRTEGQQFADTVQVVSAYTLFGERHKHGGQVFCSRIAPIFEVVVQVPVGIEQFGREQFRCNGDVGLQYSRLFGVVQVVVGEQCLVAFVGGVDSRIDEYAVVGNQCSIRHVSVLVLIAFQFL